MIKAGPFGASYACGDWDEKGKAALCRIYICHTEDGIHSIQFAYKEGTSFAVSDRYGENGEGKFESVNIGYPTEVLTGVSGYHFLENTIGSITFTTNQRTYGPFGSRKNGSLKSFVFEFGAGEFFGFHGYGSYKSSTSLGGIGVYLKPCTLPSSQSTFVVKSERSF